MDFKLFEISVHKRLIRPNYATVVQGCELNSMLVTIIISIWHCYFTDLLLLYNFFNVIPVISVMLWFSNKTKKYF